MIFFFFFSQGIIKKFKLNKIKIRNWIYQVIGTKTHTHTQGWTKILTSLGGPKYKQNNNKKKKFQIDIVMGPKKIFRVVIKKFKLYKI